jgi:putative dimethyl sulfoxide reductase chaperone
MDDGGGARPAAEAAAMIPPALAEAIADDLETLALLQDCELAPATLAGLWEIAFPENLGFRPAGEASRQAFDLAGRAMRMLALESAADGPIAMADRLAADYAGIYLNGSLGASPCESAWVSDDRLVCQDAMFQLRDLYAQFGLQGPGWRRRFDDHLVLQLQFVAHLLRQGHSAEDWRCLARVLDDHLLRWSGAFAQRVATRCATPFYAGLVELTSSHLDGLREILETVLGEVRQSAEEIEARCRPGRQAEAAPVTFVPGAGGPSW